MYQNKAERKRRSREENARRATLGALPTPAADVEHPAPEIVQ
jgi:hypothetical protein